MDCWSAYVCSCVSAYWNASPSGHPFTFTNIVAFSGQSSRITWGGFAVESADFSFTQSNFTANRVFNRDSAFISHLLVRLRFQHISLNSNVGRACLHHQTSSPSGGLHRFLSVHSNKCGTLFCSSIAWTISDSVISRNSADLFTAGEHLTFVNCVFDAAPFSAVGSDFSTINCRISAVTVPIPGHVLPAGARLLDGSPTQSFPESVTKTASRRPFEGTPTPSDDPTQTFTTSQEPLPMSVVLPLALGIPAGLVVIAVAGFCFWRCCMAGASSEHAREPSPPDGLISETLIDTNETMSGGTIDITFDGLSVLYPPQGPAPPTQRANNALWELSDD
jgi:hypothetical protein